MATYPYYTIGSLSFNDSSGRWNEQYGSPVLPSFPGVESTKISLPGVPGDIAVGTAANMATTEELLLYIHATSGGVLPGAYDDRVRNLAVNLDALYRGIQGAAAAYGGGASVPLTKFYSSTEARTAYGRFEASSKPVMDPSADIATISMLFTIPSGTWRAGVEVSPKMNVGASMVVDFLEDSTGPIADSRIVLIGPCTSATVTNRQGVGFRLALPLDAGEWTVVDTATWTYRAPSTGTPSSTASATLSSAISAVGSPLGSALVITPSAANTIVNVTMPGATSASGFMVRAMPAYF